MRTETKCPNCIYYKDKINKGKHHVKDDRFYCVKHGHNYLSDLACSEFKKFLPECIRLWRDKLEKN